jgi:hypothetical protein
MPTALQKAIIIFRIPLPNKKKKKIQQSNLLNAHPGRRVGHSFNEICMTQSTQIYFTAVLFRKIHLTNI